MIIAETQIDCAVATKSKQTTDIEPFHLENTACPFLPIALKLTSFSQRTLSLPIVFSPPQSSYAASHKRPNKLPTRRPPRPLLFPLPILSNPARRAYIISQNSRTTTSPITWILPCWVSSAQGVVEVRKCRYSMRGECVHLLRWIGGGMRGSARGKCDDGTEVVGGFSWEIGVGG